MSGYALGLIETKGKLAAIEAADVALKTANVTLLGVENATGALITVKLTGDVGAVTAAVDAASARAARLGQLIAAHVLPRPATGIRPMLESQGPCVERAKPDDTHLSIGMPKEGLPVVNERYKTVLLETQAEENTPMFAPDENAESPRSETASETSLELQAPTEPELVPTVPEQAPAEPEQAPTVPEQAPAEPEQAPTEPEQAPTEPEQALTEPEQAPTEPEQAPTEQAPTEQAPTEPEQAPTEPEQARTATCNLCGDPACPREKGESVKRCIHAGKKRGI